MTLRVGTILYGFCRGHFGSGSYSPKRIEALGEDWVVVREQDGRPNFAESFGEGTIDEILGEYATNDAREKWIREVGL